MAKEVKVVVVNGYNLASSDWTQVVWGIPSQGRLGRIPKAMYIAVREQADFIVWNTGSSMSMWNGRMLFEGEYTYETAKKFVDCLPTDFPDYFDAVTHQLARKLLFSTLVNCFEHESKKTLDSAF